MSQVLKVGMLALVILTVLMEKLGTEERDNRKKFTSYLEAPDLIKDVYVDMPWGIKDRYTFYKHNLSAFQHFIIGKDSEYRGYNWDKENNRLIPNEDWASLKLMFDMALKGSSYKSILLEYKKRGILSPSGQSEWNKTALSNIFHNPVYAG